MKKYLPALMRTAIAFALLAMITFLQANLDFREELRSKLKEKVIYLPSSRYAKLIALGYDNIFADFFHLWGIQFFSEKYELYRFKVIWDVYEFITELDPRYIEAYRIGALIMVKDVYGRQKNPDGIKMAMRLLEKGMKKNSRNWILPFEAAQYAHFDLKEPETANKYYQMTLKSPELPPFYKRRIMTAVGDTMEGFNTQQALTYWYNLWRNAKDEIVRNIAFSHFYDLKLDMDITFILRAIEGYKKKYDRLPGRLSDLIRGKIVPTLPYDPYGLPYLYDPTTGKVDPPRGYILKRHRA